MTTFQNVTMSRSGWYVSSTASNLDLTISCAKRAKFWTHRRSLIDASAHANVENSSAVAVDPSATRSNSAVDSNDSTAVDAIPTRDIASINDFDTSHPSTTTKTLVTPTRAHARSNVSSRRSSLAVSTVVTTTTASAVVDRASSRSPPSRRRTATPLGKPSTNAHEALASSTLSPWRR